MSKPSVVAFTSPKSIRVTSRPWGASINSRLGESLTTRINRAIHARVLAVNAARAAARKRPA